MDKNEVFDGFVLPSVGSMGNTRTKEEEEDREVFDGFSIPSVEEIEPEVTSSIEGTSKVGRVPKSDIEGKRTTVDVEQIEKVKQAGIDGNLARNMPYLDDEIKKDDWKKAYNSVLGWATGEAEVAFPEASTLGGAGVRMTATDIQSLVEGYKQQGFISPDSKLKVDVENNPYVEGTDGDGNTIKYSLTPVGKGALSWASSYLDKTALDFPTDAITGGMGKSATLLKGVDDIPVVSSAVSALTGEYLRQVIGKSVGTQKEISHTRSGVSALTGSLADSGIRIVKKIGSKILEPFTDAFNTGKPSRHFRKYFDEDEAQFLEDNPEIADKLMKELSQANEFVKENLGSVVNVDIKPIQLLLRKEMLSHAAFKDVIAADPGIERFLKGQSIQVKHAMAELLNEYNTKNVKKPFKMVEAMKAKKDHLKEIKKVAGDKLERFLKRPDVRTIQLNAAPLLNEIAGVIPERPKAKDLDVIRSNEVLNLIFEKDKMDAIAKLQEKVVKSEAFLKGVSESTSKGLKYSEEAISKNEDIILSAGKELESILKMTPPELQRARKQLNNSSLPPDVKARNAGLVANLLKTTPGIDKIHGQYAKASGALDKVLDPKKSKVGVLADIDSGSMDTFVDTLFSQTGDRTKESVDNALKILEKYDSLNGTNVKGAVISHYVMGRTGAKKSDVRMPVTPGEAELTKKYGSGDAIAFIKDLARFHKEGVTSSVGDQIAMEHLKKNPSKWRMFQELSGIAGMNVETRKFSGRGKELKDLTDAGDILQTLKATAGLPFSALPALSTMEAAVRKASSAKGKAGKERANAGLAKLLFADGKEFDAIRDKVMKAKASKDADAWLNYIRPMLDILARKPLEYESREFGRGISK